MYKSEIEIKGIKHPVKFTTWVMRKLEEAGFETSEIYVNISKKIYSFFPIVLFYGILNGVESKEVDITQDEVFDWVDVSPGGLIAGKGNELLALFQRSIMEGVPQPTESEIKKATKTAGAGTKAKK